MNPWAVGATMWVMAALYLAFLLAPRMNHDANTPDQNEADNV